MKVIYLFVVLLFHFFIVSFSGILNIQVLNSGLKYGTPNCSLRVSMMYSGEEDLSTFYSNTSFSFVDSQFTLSGLMYTTIIDFNVPVDKYIQINSDSTINPNCVSPPIPGIVNITKFSFTDKLHSPQIISYVQLNYKAYYETPTCSGDTASHLNKCFRCEMKPILPYSSGYFSITIDPIIVTNCAQEISTMAQLSTFMLVFDTANGTRLPQLTTRFLNLYNGLYSPTAISFQTTYQNPPQPLLKFYGRASPSVTTMIGLNDKYPQFGSMVTTTGSRSLLRYIGYDGTDSKYMLQKQFNSSENSIFSIVNYALSQNMTSISVNLGNTIVIDEKNSDLIVNSISEFIYDGNIYTSTNFSTPQSNSLKVEYNSWMVKFGYPLGFGSGTLKNYNHNFDFPFSAYQNSLNIQPFYQDQTILSHTYKNLGINFDIVPPILKSYLFKSDLNMGYEISIGASDLQSGIKSISIQFDDDPRNDGLIVLTNSNLNSGSIWDGVFSRNITYQGFTFRTGYTIIIEDRSGLISRFKSDTFIPGTKTLIAKFPKKVAISFDSFDDFYPNQTYILSNSTYQSVILNFRFKQSFNYPLMVSYLYDASDFNRAANRIFYLCGKNITSGYHQCQLRIPPYYTTLGDNFQFIVHGDVDIPSTQFFSFFDKTSLLILNSDNSSLIGPMYKSIIMSANDTHLIINATFICYGLPKCGTIKGTLTVQGEYDPTQFEFVINSLNQESLRIEFAIDSKFCRNQLYTIIGSTLTDDRFNSNTTDAIIDSPFSLLPNPRNISVYFNRCTSVVDNVPPKLDYFYYSLNINTSLLSIYSMVSDNIKLKSYSVNKFTSQSLPKLYLTYVGGSILQYSSPNFLLLRNSLSIQYDIDITSIPKGNISLSLYGLLDHYDNFNGYSTLELSGFNRSVVYIPFANEIPQPYPYLPVINPTTTPIQCTNKCSGNGICIGNNQCQCNNGFYGPNCEGTILIIPKPLPNPEEPTIISDPNSNVNLDIQFSELLELDSDKSTIERYPLQNKKWNLETSSDNNTFTYSTKINNETTLYIIIDLTTDERTIEFAGLNITIPPHSIKYTMKLDQYSFKSQLNILQLRMSTAFKSSESLCSSSIDTSSNTKDLEYIKIQYNGKILFGRFIQRSLVDGIPQVATTELIQSTESNGTSFIGINIPNYSSQVILDPNFSVLVTDDYDKCETSSRLSTGAIIGIVVGAALVVFLSLSGIFLFSKSRRARILYKIQSLRKTRKSKDVELNS